MIMIILDKHNLSKNQLNKPNSIAIITVKQTLDFYFPISVIQK